MAGTAAFTSATAASTPARRLTSLAATSMEAPSAAAFQPRSKAFVAMPSLGGSAPITIQDCMVMDSKGRQSGHHAGSDQSDFRLLLQHTKAVHLSGIGKRLRVIMQRDIQQSRRARAPGSCEPDHGHLRDQVHQHPPRQAQRIVRHDVARHPLPAWPDPHTRQGLRRQARLWAKGDARPTTPPPSRKPSTPPAPTARTPSPTCPKDAMSSTTRSKSPARIISWAAVDI